jgi:hypothetical protein
MRYISCSAIGGSSRSPAAAKQQINGCMHSFGHPQARTLRPVSAPATAQRSFAKLDEPASDVCAP